MTKNMKKIFLGMLLMFGAHSAQAMQSGTLADLGTISLSSAPGTGVAAQGESGKKFARFIKPGLSFGRKVVTHRVSRVAAVFVLMQWINAYTEFDGFKFPNYPGMSVTEKRLHAIRYSLSDATFGASEGVKNVVALPFRALYYTAALPCRFAKYLGTSACGRLGSFGEWMQVKGVGFKEFMREKYTTLSAQAKLKFNESVESFCNMFKGKSRLSDPKVLKRLAMYAAFFAYVVWELGADAKTAGANVGSFVKEIKK